jgi:hypothetical protein
MHNLHGRYLLSTHRQPLQGFPDVCTVWLQGDKSAYLFYSSSCQKPEATFAINFISERSVTSSLKSS